MGGKQSQVKKQAVVIHHPHFTGKLGSSPCAAPATQGSQTMKKYLKHIDAAAGKHKSPVQVGLALMLAVRTWGLT